MNETDRATPDAPAQALRMAVLIDFASVAYPIWATSQSEPDPDITSRKIVSAIREYAQGQPHVAICCDGGRSFRHDLLDTYKANRGEKDQTFLHQMQLAEESLKTEGFPIWRAAGFEADDVLAAATSKALAAGAAVTIVTADKDLLQLVQDGVAVLRPGAHNSLTAYDKAMVVEKFGVRPDQFVDYLTLVGDSADNVKGARDVGPVTAAKLLSAHGTLSAVYEEFRSVGGPAMGLNAKVTKGLHEFDAQRETWGKIFLLRTDAPIPQFEDLWKSRTPQEAEMTDAAEFEPIHDVSVAHALVPPAQVAEALGAELVRQPSGPRDLSPIVGAVGLAFDIRWYEQARVIASDIFKSRLIGGAFSNAAAVLLVIQAGTELGMSPMRALRAFHIVEGRPVLAADALRGLALQSPHCEYLRCVERTPERATFETKRKGDPEPTRLTYTMTEAQASGRVKQGSAYTKDPSDMLAARASSKLVRLVYPDVLHGLYAPEEIES